MSARSFIGTSGFSYDHWADVFYPPKLPQKARLSFYSSQFTTVEINATFYRLQNVSTFKRWHEETPAGFRFSIKGSRYITHLKRLRDTQSAVRRFFAPTAALDEKLAVSLWQTPPDFIKDLSILEEFLTILNKESPSSIRNAFEFRSEDWFTPETYSLLDKKDCGLVIADSDRFSVAKDIVCGRFAYLRFHGRAANAYSYNDRDLDVWAEKINRWTSEGFDVYAYFNNDTRAQAVQNAKYLSLLTKK